MSKMCNLVPAWVMAQPTNQNSPNMKPNAELSFADKKVISRWLVQWYNPQITANDKKLNLSVH